MYSLIYFRSKNGNCPVWEYLDALNPIEAAWVTCDLDLLQEFGPALGLPYVGVVQEGMMQLKCRVFGRHRVLYSSVAGQSIVLLHALSKSNLSSKAVASHIERAAARLADYRPGFHETTHRSYIASRAATDQVFGQARETIFSRYERCRALISARVNAGLTQHQLAVRLNTTEPAIARLEGGTYTPTINTLLEMAVELGVEFIVTADSPLAVIKSGGRDISL